MRKFILLIMAAPLLMLCRCADEPRPALPVEMPLVIEGWIEEGGRPQVIVTRAIDLTKPMDTLENYVEKWCRVSVSDGEEKHYLIARKNDDYMPSFVYTTSALRGEAGKEYTLTVETDNDTVVAVARILRSLPIDSLQVGKTVGNDTLYRVNAFAAIDAEGEKRYYKFFSRVVNEEKRFYSSFLGTFDNSVYNPAVGYSVSRGIHFTFESDKKFTPYYALGDTVDVKLYTIDAAQFDFWNAYENAVSLSGNAFFSIAHDCPGNIPGALGYWFGYGVSSRRIVIKEP